MSHVTQARAATRKNQANSPRARHFDYFPQIRSARDAQRNSYTNSPYAITAQYHRMHESGERVIRH